MNQGFWGCGVLGFVWMGLATINLQFLGHMFPQCRFWQHAANGFGQDFGRLFGVEMFGRDRFNATRIPRVVIIGLHAKLIPRELNLAGINHNDMVPGINIRGKGRFMFPA